jgi:hypothetical protein
VAQSAQESLTILPLTFACFHLPTPNAATAKTYWALFALMAASVRRVVPDAEIHLLTHEEAEVPDGIPATHIFRRAAGESIKESFAHLMRAETQTWREYISSDALRGPTLLMDIDILVQRDPSGLFDGSFDIGLTYTNDATLHPFNAGVLLIDPTKRKSPILNFFAMLDETVVDLVPEYQEWYGDQIALMQAVGADDVSTWRGVVDLENDGIALRLFPAEEWNASLALDAGNTPIFASMPEAGLVHFKGERKGLMLRYATEVLGIAAREDASAPGGWIFD